MKEKLREEKRWLKATANEIRETRKEWKETQRNNDFSFPSWNDPKWEEKLDARRELYIPANKLWQLTREYRHRHIAYSLARGRTYFEVERSVREGNDPNFKIVAEHLTDKYGLTARDLESLPKKLRKELPAAPICPKCFHVGCK